MEERYLNKDPNENCENGKLIQLKIIQIMAAAGCSAVEMQEEDFDVLYFAVGRL